MQSVNNIVICSMPERTSEPAGSVGFKVLDGTTSDVIGLTVYMSGPEGLEKGDVIYVNSSFLQSPAGKQTVKWSGTTCLNVPFGLVIAIDRQQ